MISKLRQLIHAFIADSDENISAEEEKMLAVYGILFEAARSDHHVDPREEEKIKEIMGRYFNLCEEDFQRIKTEAETLHINSSDMFNITREVRNHLTREERLTLLDELWEVAFSDGYLDPQETALVRRLADLLGLEHQEYINSKIRVATNKS